MSQRPRRVLFFTVSLGSGGAEMHLLRLANALDREKWKPSIALVRRGGSYEKRLASDVPVHHLGTGNVDSTTLQMVRSVRPLRALVATQAPDVVCPVMDLASIAAMQALRRMKRAPLLVPSVQVPPAGQRNYDGSAGGVAKLYEMVERYLTATTYRRANHIVAISKGLTQEVTALAPEAAAKMSVVYNAGVDDSVIKQARRSLDEEEQRDTDPTVVACGRLSPQKGFTYLLDAFQVLRQQVPARLVILGEGPLREPLQQRAERLGLSAHVKMPGFVDNPFKYMASADLFVLSSMYEGFGNVVAEAMACGTPVVSTDCPHGPGEIVQAEESGLLVPPADVEALATAMSRVLKNDAFARKLARNGKKRSEYFTAEASARGYEKVFDEAVGIQRTVAPVA